MGGKKKTFTFQRFSRKQLKILTWWRGTSPYAAFDGVIADGAIRSGKTVSMSLSFMMWAMSQFREANFAICGKTIGALRRNVITPLKQMMPALRCECVDKRAENLLVVRRNGVANYFYLFGGKDEGSQDLIQGITLAGAFFDEVALMPQSFVNQATARCSVEGAKWWFNCNPEGPFHWFKTEWIDRVKERGLLYLHFDMCDNETLSPKTLARYRAMYTGVFERRFIRGEWAAADGVIYSMFDPGRHIKADLPFAPEREFVAVDYGTYNPCVFLHFFACGQGETTRYFVDREYYFSGRGGEEKEHRTIQKDDGQYAADMLAFCGGRKDLPVIVDPSASSLMTRLRHEGFTQVLPARNAVAKGIAAVSAALAGDRLSFSPDCRYTLRELPSYVWDVKAAAKCGQDKPLKENDHCCDALRYGVYFDSLVNVSSRPSVSGHGAR
ncbi:MAG: PBSX family phage terminase large subunit [Clostridia bacterium]|nr:PBSX family phage terminase large subunit [Clostridia bacterium]